ncbi:UDP-N-acetylmuramoyl-L-alanine--D-glutamate ligase [Candidatus Legionella polyplacis]|uniref:UDP-N-acetylmuramoylalanine--D-glutamate ligase n=1 Tax=Candidatus Legionella polyplacis TaxID=2005262 RepID=A0ABZ2H0K9_9GAMM
MFYLVAGLGKTGLSVSRYLWSRNKSFIVFNTYKDTRRLSIFIKNFPSIKIYVGSIPVFIYKKVKAVILSPGICLNEDFVRKAVDLNIPIFGDIEYLIREIKFSSRIIAVTGTNGKSTVVTLLGEMIKFYGLSVIVAGNIGLPVFDVLLKNNIYDIWILELSSFQLNLIKSLKPFIATILNISPDHLDRHLDLFSYIDIKQRIYKNADYVLYNRDDYNTFPKNFFSCDKKYSFSLEKPNSFREWGILTIDNISYISNGSEILLNIEDINIKGRQNCQNALAACALATHVGIDKNSIITVLKSYSGLPYRCQWIYSSNGIRWINDSKSTNIGATISAILSVNPLVVGKIILIIGGDSKNADFSILCEYVRKYVRVIVTMGKDANKIKSVFLGIVPIYLVFSLKKAMLVAKSKAKFGDAILFSPACSSLDMFRDFNHRGEIFNKLLIKI